eukprot:10508611-Alexandrium_andersonii.AAC.1
MVRLRDGLRAGLRPGPRDPLDRGRPPPFALGEAPGREAPLAPASAAAAPGSAAAPGMGAPPPVTASSWLA